MSFKESIKGIFSKKSENVQPDKVIGGGEVFVGLFKDEKTNKELEEASQEDREKKALENFKKGI